MKYQANDIFELSNQLSRNDMCELINTFTPMSIHFGTLGRYAITSELYEADTNGGIIELVAGSVCLDDLRDDPFIDKAIRESSK